ncbi:hypothetical protein V9K46_004330 [Vibrio parahaemolyticus]
MSKAYDIKRSQLGWSLLSGLGKSKFIKTFNIWFVIIPIAAKLIEKFPDALNFNLFGQSLSLTWGLPFSWQALYLAALFFTLANVIYTIFCPAIIKNYESFNDFMHKDGSSEAIKHLFEPLLNRSEPGYSEMLAKNFRSHVPMTKPRGSDSWTQRQLFDSGRVHNDNLSEAFSNVKGAFEHEQAKIQWVAMSFYIAGFIILLYLLGMNVCYVFDFNIWPFVR